MSKLNVITNFIDYWTSDEEERERMYQAANDYLDQDHVDRRIDDVKEALGYYISNDLADHDRIIEALQNAEDRSVDADGFKFGDGEDDEIIMWEPLEGRYTVEDLCEMINL